MDSAAMREKPHHQKGISPGILSIVELATIGGCAYLICGDLSLIDRQLSAHAQKNSPSA
jgi:hypothetical protein